MWKRFWKWFNESPIERARLATDEELAVELRKSSSSMMWIARDEALARILERGLGPKSGWYTKSEKLG